MLRCLLGSGLVALVFVSSASAQVNPIFDMPVLTMNSAISANSKHIAEQQGQRTPRQGEAKHRPVSRALSKPRSANLAMRYTSSPSLRKQVLASFLTRVGKTNPSYAALARQEFAVHDYSTIYRQIVSPYGLAEDDLADTITAYLTLSNLIVNGDRDVSRASLQGLRGRVAETLSQEPRFTRALVRGETAEEFKILFVTLHAGWQSAKREGTLPAYAQSVATMVRQQSGIDLRRVSLDGGFTVRR